jgi:hypothetical protein
VTPTGVATASTCAVSDQGGTTIFGDSYAAGWSDSSWSGAATLTATGGANGTAGLTAVRPQNDVLGLQTTAAGGGIDTISFDVKGTGEWQVLGFEKETSHGSAPFKPTGVWQTLNCRFDTPIVGGPLWFAFQNMSLTPSTLSIDNVKIRAGASNANAGLIVSTVGVGPGYTATPTITGGTVSTQTVFAGPGLNGADAIRLDVAATAGFSAKLTNESGTITYADISFAPGTVVHWFPLTVSLGAERVRLTITPGAAPVTLKRVDLKNNPFVPITIGTTTNSSVNATVGLLPEAGLALTLRAIPADQSNSCQTCGVAVPVTTSGAYTISGLSPGSWRLVMYANSAQETLGTSLDFTISEPPQPPVTTLAATTTTTRPPVSFPSFAGAEYQIKNGLTGLGAGCESGVWTLPAAIRSDAWNGAYLKWVGTPGYGYAYFTNSEITYTDGYASRTISAGANFAPDLYLAAAYTPVALDDIPSGTSVTSFKLNEWICPYPGVQYQIFLVIPSSSGVIPTTIMPGPPTSTPQNPDPVSPQFDRTSNFLRTAYWDTNSTGDICIQPSDGAVLVGACINGTTPNKNLAFEEVATNQFRIRPSNQPGTCLQIGNKRHPVQQDPTSNSNAFVTEWGPCNGQPANALGKQGYLDELWTFTESRAGWYTIKPSQNAANLKDPCLSIWAAPPTATNQSGAVTGNGYAAPVIQFECQVGNPAWQEWAPSETPGARGTVPQGAHLLQHGVATSLERKTDLACINATNAIAQPTATNDCRFFVPEQVIGGWLLHDDVDATQCLGPIPGTLTVGMTGCGNTSIWDDWQAIPGELTFPLKNVPTGKCLGGTAMPVIQTCAPDPSQLWYDKPKSTTTTTTTTTTTSVPSQNGSGYVIPAPTPLTPLAPTAPPPLVAPPNLPPGGVPYWVLAPGEAVAAGSVAIAGAAYAYWEWSTYLQGDDFEINFGSLKDRTKGINRFRLSSGKKCSDYNPIWQYRELSQALSIMNTQWKQQQTMRTPQQDGKTTMAGVWCIDTPNGSITGTLWSLSGRNGGLNVLPQKNNYDQPGLFEHSQSFGESLKNSTNGQYHAEMNALGRLADEKLLTSSSTGFVLLLGANQNGTICQFCQENLPDLAARYPKMNFDVKVDKYDDLEFDHYVHSWYTSGSRWFFNDRSNSQNNKRGTR